jgi:hypothetical protein
MQPPRAFVQPQPAFVPMPMSPASNDDGFVTLGSYGRVYSKGLNAVETLAAVQFHLAKFIEKEKPQPVPAYVPVAVVPQPMPIMVQPNFVPVEPVPVGPPYKLRTFDIVKVDVVGTPPENPISGYFTVEQPGVLQFGSRYGNVHIAGQSVEQAQTMIKRVLEEVHGIANTDVSVKLHSMRKMPLKIYCVADIVRGDIGISSFNIFVRMVKSVYPPSWDEEDVFVIPNETTHSLAVRHTEEVHAHIERMFNEMRMAIANQSPMR